MLRLTLVGPVLVFSTVALAAHLQAAEEQSTVGLHSLPSVELSALSSPDPNPLGAEALALRPEQWKHGETEHFIYHFIHGYVATPVSVEAEFCFRVISEQLDQETIAAARSAKSHIYIFEKPEDWQLFQARAALEPWTGGIHSQGSLFIVRDPANKFANNSLGHEIAHLVLFRLYQQPLPLWLNEGFAEYSSRVARASYQRARNYIAHPRSAPIPREQLIPLARLTAMDGYPSSDITVFYGESERLVRFLVAVNRRRFSLCSTPSLEAKALTAHCRAATPVASSTSTRWKRSLPVTPLRPPKRSARQTNLRAFRCQSWQDSASVSGVLKTDEDKSSRSPHGQSLRRRRVR
jgi:hypothetical protein